MFAAELSINRSFWMVALPGGRADLVETDQRPGCDHVTDRRGRARNSAVSEAPELRSASSRPGSLPMLSPRKRPRPC